ncbi:MAG: HEAT repeat domain-containing protein [Planctomycetota bacterium]
MTLPRLVLVSALVLGAILASPGPAGAGPEAAAEQRFLADRDARALDQVLAAAGEPATSPRRILARLAFAGADEQVRQALADPAAGSPVARGVAALHDLDLRGACAAVRCQEANTRDVDVAWFGALVLARRGDDSGAIGRLLGPVEVRTAADRFALALLSAALPPTERAMLASAAERALQRASARGRVAAFDGLVEGALAVAPERMASIGLQAVRAWRRAGRREGAYAWLARLPRGDAGLDLERVLLAPSGTVTPALPVAHADAPALGPVLEALRQRGPPPAAWVSREPLPHAVGARHDALLLARLARRHGIAATADGVLRAAERDGAPASRAAWGSAWLASHDLVVLHGADDAELPRTLVDRGIPFLAWRVDRVGASYRERCVLVLGRDPASGTWWVDEPDLTRPDVLPPDALAKARFVAVLPRARAAAFEAWRARPGAALGARLEAARARAEAADWAGAASLLAEAGPSPVEALARALARYDEALAAPTREGWLEAEAAARGALEVPPRLGFEAFLTAQAAAVRGDPQAALAALADVEACEGPSASVELVRHAAFEAAGRRDEALRALDAAAAIDPLDARPLLYRGTARGVDPGAALADLMRAFDRTPDDARIAVALAGALARQERGAEALEVLRVARRHARGEADVRVLDGARQHVELRLIQDAASGDDLTGFERSNDPETRRRAAFQLADLGTPEAEAQLRGLLLDASADLRLTVLRLYLRPRLRAHVAADPVLGRRVVALLEADPDDAVRAAAARLLGHVDEAFARRALADRLRGRAADADASVRAAAALALRGREDAGSRAALVDALADAEASVRRVAGDMLFEQAATRLGFDAEGPALERAEAIRAWRDWLRQETTDR